MILLPLFFCVSCEEILFERDISEGYVELFAPGNGAIVESNEVRLSWSSVTGAEEYLVQIGRPDFSATSELLVNEIVEEEKFDVELPEGSYQWRVKALNSAYETRYQTAAFEVKMSEEFHNRNVILSSPKDNLLTNNFRQQLEWEKIENATIYRIQIKSNDSIFWEATTSNNNLMVDFPNGAFIWGVRGETGSENTLYSRRSIFIDTIAPAKPTLISPLNKDTLVNPSVSFKWQVETQEGASEFDSIYIGYDSALLQLVQKSVSADKNFNFTFDKDSTYYWQVKRFDKAGNKGEESLVKEFKLKISD